jgi:hypothetical protein
MKAKRNRTKPTLKQRKERIQQAMVSSPKVEIKVTEEVLVEKGLLKPKTALSEAAIMATVRDYEKSQKFPLKLSCVRCGTPKFAYNAMHQRIREFGTFENLVRAFTCRACGKETKIVTKKVVKKIKEEKKAEEQKFYAPGSLVMTYSPMREYDFSKPADVIAYTTGMCARPALYLNNGRNCEGCPFFKHCVAGPKRAKGERLTRREKMEEQAAA